MEPKNFADDLFSKTDSQDAFCGSISFDQGFRVFLSSGIPESGKQNDFVMDFNGFEESHEFVLDFLHFVFFFGF